MERSVEGRMANKEDAGGRELHRER